MANKPLLHFVVDDESSSLEQPHFVLHVITVKGNTFITVIATHITSVSKVYQTN